MVDAIGGWARRTTTSFTELCGEPSRPTEDSSEGQPGDPIYRLRHWPELPQSLRSVGALRLLSVMSSRPVRRGWVLLQTGWSEAQLDRLLARLARQGALETIDPARLPKEHRPD